MLKREPTGNARSRYAAIVVLGCYLHAAAPAADSNHTAGLGGPAAVPATVLTDLHGNRKTLSDFEGKVVLLNFWTSWCPPCIGEMPALKRLSRAMDGRPFALLAINVAEGRGILQRFASLEEAGIQLLSDSDGSVAKNWGIEVYPTSVIVDGLGRRHATIVGETDWDTQASYDQLEVLIRTTTPMKDD
jgi:thiol-disulfide isomerase/thioredoxin